MHQLQGLVGPGGTQHLDDAKTDAAAAMHSDAGRLIEHQQALILVDDRRLDLLDQPGRNGFGRSRIGGLDLFAVRRYPQDVALGHPAVGFDAFAVQPHLAFAQQPEQVAARDRTQKAGQQAIDPLAGLLRANGDQTDGSVARGRLRGYRGKSRFCEVIGHTSVRFC